MNSLKGYPDPYLFADGTRVKTKEDWGRRAKELEKQYQDEMYGCWRFGEKVSYEISDTEAEIRSFFGTYTVEGSKSLTVKIVDNGRKTEFTVPVCVPDEKSCKKPEGGWPFIVCFHDIMPRKYAVEHGFAVIVMNSNGIASDDYAHNGCFYDIHPYDAAKADEQTGVLMAWSWGAAKILDAVYGGAGRELGINPEMSVITGVSRWGKATAVCGAYEKRFKMVVPSCSGAGGLALYRYVSEGTTYDFSSKEGPAEYTYTKNEPLGSLQADGEKGWFNEYFASYREADDIKLEQYELAALSADSDRLFFMIGSCISEDWVNAPAMWACWRAAEKIYDFIGLGDNIYANIHKEGHAVTEEDMVYLIELFNRKYYGIEPKSDLSVLKTSVFEEEKNFDPLFETLGKDWKH